MKLAYLARAVKNFRLKIAVIAALALLSVQASGLHLHLCFDGSEAPSTLHSQDTGHDDHHHASASHDDLDVPLPDKAPAKPIKLGLDFVWLIVGLALFLFTPAVRTLRLAPVHALGVAEPWRLHPPSRGPPSFISR